MPNYRTLSKSQLIELINEIENILTPSIQSASDAAKRYSTELQSQTSFEIGHLNGSIKSVVQLINEYKNC
jgi:hypothetical protein